MKRAGRTCQHRQLATVCIPGLLTFHRERSLDPTRWELQSLFWLEILVTAFLARILLKELAGETHWRFLEGNIATAARGSAHQISAANVAPT